MIRAWLGNDYCPELRLDGTVCNEPTTASQGGNSGFCGEHLAACVGASLTRRALAGEIEVAGCDEDGRLSYRVVR